MTDKDMPKDDTRDKSGRAVETGVNAPVEPAAVNINLPRRDQVINVGDEELQRQREINEDTRDAATRKRDEQKAAGLTPTKAEKADSKDDDK